MSDLRIAGTVGESITDGPGFRFTIFTQGCPHHCEGCHNPQTHDYTGGEIVDTDVLWEKINKNILLSGVTLSGGEPFEQAGALIELAQKVKRAGLELAAYSGYTIEQLIAAGGDKFELLKLCDVLVDGRFVLAEKSLMLRFRGSKNQRLIDVKKTLESGQVVLIHDGRWQD